MKVIFRANTSKTIGGGHIRRCLTLADELSSLGATCQFISNSSAVDIVNPFNHYKILPEDTSPFKADLLVVDHYELDKNDEEKWRPFIQKIMVIDDLANRKHDCDYLLDQTYGRKEEAYTPYVPSHCQLLLGTDYALLRPQFAECRKKSISCRTGNIENILINYGSVDTHNLCPLTLEALQHIKTPLRINIICEEDHPSLKKMKIQAKLLHHDVYFHHHVQDMATLMSQADLALGAAGTTTWERCTVGLPALIFQVAENQSLILENLSKQGAIINLGKAENATSSIIYSQINNLISHREYLMIMSVKASQVVHGTGAKKVAQILLQKEF